MLVDLKELEPKQLVLEEPEQKQSVLDQLEQVRSVPYEPIQMPIDLENLEHK